MKAPRSIRDNKGYLFSVDDESVGRCRDVRGFADAIEFLKDRSNPKPERLVLVIPTIPMEDYLTKWAEDESHVRRKLSVTRRATGQQIAVTATIATYGYGVDPSLQIERLAAAEAAVPAAVERAAELQASPVVPPLKLVRRRTTGRKAG